MWKAAFAGAVFGYVVRVKKRLARLNGRVNRLKRELEPPIISGHEVLDSVARRSTWRLVDERGLVCVELYASTGSASARRGQRSVFLEAAAECGLLPAALR